MGYEYEEVRAVETHERLVRVTCDRCQDTADNLDSWTWQFSPDEDHWVYLRACEVRLPWGATFVVCPGCAAEICPDEFSEHAARLLELWDERPPI